MKTPIQFIIIDDDVTNNMLCSIVIQEIIHKPKIKTFTNPREGFGYLANEYLRRDADIPSILFLDINMPTLTGWEFLKKYEALDEKIKHQIKVYMLSSSVDPIDKERARNNPNVVDYIVKPLSPKVVSNILMVLHKEV